MSAVLDQLPLRGEIRVDTFDGDLPFMNSRELLDFLDGRWPLVWDTYHRETAVYRNLVTNVGRQQITKLVVAETTLGVGYCAVSTSVIAPALTDLTLPNEQSRKAVAVKQSISTYYQRYVTYYLTTDFNSTGINSAGLFDTASTGGNMFADATISLSKPTTTSATVDWRIQATTG